MIKKDAIGIWGEYNDGVSYKTTLELYDNVKYNQNFYLGKQWEGVPAPDIEKPVLNIVKQWVDYAVSMLVSDDIGVNVTLPNYLSDETRTALEYVINEAIMKVLERTKFRTKTRGFIKNASLDGDSLFHWWYNTDKRKDQAFIGDIDLEILDNTNVIFGDPAEPNVEYQPYVIIVSKLLTDTVKDMAKANEGEVMDDADDYNQREMDAKTVKKYTTVLTKLWKEDGEVRFMKTTQKLILVPETGLGQALYPINKMSWKTQKNSYHGVSPITEIRQNQIMINKYYMMLNEYVKKLAFPKLLYDMTKIATWSNKVEALGVNGDPREAIAVSSPTIQISTQIIDYINDLVDKTKAALGIFDVALGDVDPVNTSAIIAVQKSASQPLELQKLDYYQVVEDSVHIIMDIMAAFYGIRPVTFETDTVADGKMAFNFADLRNSDIEINVEVGAAAYWSEITQIQTLDNMYKAGIIPDPITYLEQLPKGILPNKGDIIDAIREMQQNAMMMQAQGLDPATGQPIQPDVSSSRPVSQPTYAGGSINGITQRGGAKPRV
jgi:hypothetical protein